MGMQSYGQFALKANIDKINKADKELQKKYNRFKELLDESDCSPQELDYGYIDEVLDEALADYIEDVDKELGIQLYIQYVDSEAEGTDMQGGWFFAINFSLPENQEKYSKGWEAWSIFG